MVVISSVALVTVEDGPASEPPGSALVGSRVVDGTLPVSSPRVGRSPTHPTKGPPRTHAAMNTHEGARKRNRFISTGRSAY